MFRVRSSFLAVTLAAGTGLALLSGLQASEPATGTLSGTVRVIDGDTLDLSGNRIRLFGIDAPEGNQTCEDSRGAVWACGDWVTEQVRARYDGATATCTQRDIDRYDRVVAVCTVSGRDINEEIVREGWAVAYRRYSWDYDLAEKSAQVAGAGLWAHSFILPEEHRNPAPQLAAGDCNIKGNISSNGHIYHMPHNRDYDRTVINEAQGERWFCTPQEAEAAGWRAARN